MIDQNLRKEYLAVLRTKGYIYISIIQTEDQDEMIYSLIESGEYFLDLTPVKKEFVIRRDHRFALSQSIKTTNIWMRFSTVIIALAAAATYCVSVKSLQLQREINNIKQNQSTGGIKAPTQPISLQDTSFSVKHKELLNAPKLHKPDSAKSK